MKINWLTLLLVMLSGLTMHGQDTTRVISEDKKLVYVFDMKDMIGPGIWRQTQQAFEQADTLDADLIIIEMNTYGGMLDAADSIRTKILNEPRRVHVFINNNAASAGALISLACDSIFMRTGGNIGAATVVNQSGEQMPDKYQAYMRSLMRSTAESHGKDTIITDGDTLIQWRRDPLIAEAMVDSRTVVPGIVDSTRVLSFTTDEAIQYGFCEGKADNFEDVIKQSGIDNYEVKKYEVTSMEKMIGWLVNPVISGILIMIIIGGIYFELQTPGIGFPLAAAALAAILYFAPLYLEGLAENWEILLFIVGIILIAVEIFAIPGFGVAGISGVILLVTGLTLSLVDNIVFEFEYTNSGEYLFRALLIVVVSMIISIIGAIYFSKKLLLDSPLRSLVLESAQDKSLGFTSIEEKQTTITGKKGVAITILRPSGKVEIEGELYDAKSEVGYIEKGDKIKVVRHEAMQLYVMKDE